MKIRSITCFCDVGNGPDEPHVAESGRWLATARESFTAEGYEVQTVRVALPPFPSIPGLVSGEVVAFARRLERACRDEGIEFVTMGPARIGDDESWWNRIPELIDATDIVFAAGEMATRERGVDLRAVRRAARVIHRCGPLRPDGFGNLRFAALAHVPAGVPFLPAAYHDGGPSRFALATEAADLAVTAFAGAAELDEAGERLVASIEEHAARLVAVAERLDGPAFGGLDFSLAPFPTADRSIGVALESLGLPALGRPGSLTTAAFLTQCVDRARFPRAGFSGLFLPLLEDDRLALRGAEGVLGLDELLLYAAVCGTGLDTVPLPGDIREEEIVPLLLDLATLALRLDKPLTARLMPMPEREAGDDLEFDFPYFANGRVLAHRALPLHGPLAGERPLAMGPRQPRR